MSACTNCGGTGVGGYHVHAPQEDAVEALRCEACDGFGFIEHGPKDCPATAPELPLMARREWMRDHCAALSPAPEPILSTCPVCGDPDDHEHDSMAAPAPELPLMAQREWMFKGAQYAYRDRDSAWFQSVDKPGRAWEFCYRIADTDEHGLPVIERTADMPEDVTHMALHTRRFFRAGELRARSVEGDEGLLRIEDYRPTAQESGDARD